MIKGTESMTEALKKISKLWHVGEVKFMDKLWMAYDKKGRNIASGFINEEGKAQYYDDKVRPVYNDKNEIIPSIEILMDVEMYRSLYDQGSRKN